MSNQILHVRVHDHSLDPAQAELRIAVAAGRVAPTTELRGRLTGPRCAYSTTVEVAYPLRPLPDSDGLSARVVIPEPSLWEPACPFLYEGVVELWEDGARCDQAPIRRGLRRVLLGPGGLRVNGEPMLLLGRTAVRPADGFNLLLAPTADAPADVWDHADVQGCFVLGRLDDWRDASLQSAIALSDHPSCLGWLTPPPDGAEAVAAMRRLNRRALVGVELEEAPREPLPAGVNFIACPSECAEDLRPLGLPLLVYRGALSPGVFGTVE